MTLPNAIKDMQSKVSALVGMHSAPSYPPESANDFPFAVTYPRTGELALKSAGFAKFFHTLVTEIHVSTQPGLAAAMENAIPFAERLASSLLNDPTLSSSVDEVRGVRYTFGKLEWNSVQTLGYRFEVDIKCESTT